VGYERKIKRNKTQVVCVAEFHAKPGKTDELLAALHMLMEPTHTEPAFIRYEMNQAVRRSAVDHVRTAEVSGRVPGEAI
jgi:quinol monooxygenase YgiN